MKFLWVWVVDCTQTPVSPSQRSWKFSISFKGDRELKHLSACRADPGDSPQGHALSLSISVSPPSREKILQPHHQFLPLTQLHQETLSLRLWQLKDFRLFFREWGAISHHAAQRGFSVHLPPEVISTSLVLFILRYNHDKVKCMGVFWRPRDLLRLRTIGAHGRPPPKQIFYMALLGRLCTEGPEPVEQHFSKLKPAFKPLPKGPPIGA